MQMVTSEYKHEQRNRENMQVSFIHFMGAVNTIVGFPLYSENQHQGISGTFRHFPDLNKLNNQ